MEDFFIIRLLNSDFVVWTAQVLVIIHFVDCFQLPLLANQILIHLACEDRNFRLLSPTIVALLRIGGFKFLILSVINQIDRRGIYRFLKFQGWNSRYMQAFRFLFLICILKSRPQKDRIRFLHWHKHFVCHFDLRFCFASFSVTKNITGFCHLTLTHTNIFLSPFYFYPRCRTFFISLKQLLLLSFWLCRVLGISENDGTT